jgi:two-component system OmpR family response regulator
VVRVLVVEDELRLAALLKRGLSEEGYAVDVATTGTKEFALLRLFLSHPGQVLTCAQILDHVWDYAYYGVSDVVDQYVLYLRRKIDRAFGVQQRDTVRGAGYRLHQHPESGRHRFPAAGS